MPRKAVPGPKSPSSQTPPPKGVGVAPAKRKARSYKQAKPDATPVESRNADPNHPSRNDQTHYCRVCPSIITGSDAYSAHTEVRRHQRQESRAALAKGEPEHYFVHPIDLMCDRQCTAIQQPEEKEAGRMLYGNVPKKVFTPEENERLKKRYDDLFPPEDFDRD